MENNLKIATWNVRRPNLISKKQQGRVEAINTELKKYSTDIFILTETNECISPGSGYNYVHHSQPIEHKYGGNYYKKGERRISIWSKYEILKTLEVTDPLTTACAVIKTPFGELAVFGCIIGIFGRRRLFDADFDKDLQNQKEDLKRFAKEGYNICYAGDFNLTFGNDNTYTKFSARNELNELFSSIGMTNLTEKIQSYTIDHIVISNSFKTTLNETIYWNENREDQTLSDHKGVMVLLQSQ